jgi:prephenate dehydrogenase
MAEGSRTLPVIQSGQGSGVPPIFEKVAIVGLGLVGGSIALATRKNWPAGLVIGVDEKDVLEKAMRRHAIDVAADDPVVIAEADLVVLAAPVRQNVELLAELGEHIHGSAVVTDVSSTKRAVVEAARILPPRLTFVGGHPLAGAPRGGIDYARADLFSGRPWLFTPVNDSSGDALDRLSRFVTAFGAKVHMMSADDHDKLLASLSHVPQIVASTLMSIVGDAAGEKGLALAGRGLADTTRLASSPATIWRDICATNTDEIGAALDRLIAELRTLRSELESEEALDRVFESAGRWRAVLAAKRGEGVT